VRRNEPGTYLHPDPFPNMTVPSFLGTAALALVVGLPILAATGVARALRALTGRRV
jgi:hypothetical protein